MIIWRRNKENDLTTWEVYNAGGKGIAMIIAREKRKYMLNIWNESTDYGFLVSDKVFPSLKAAKHDAETFLKDYKVL